MSTTAGTAPDTQSPPPSPEPRAATEDDDDDDDAAIRIAVAVKYGTDFARPMVIRSLVDLAHFVSRTDEVSQRHRATLESDSDSSHDSD